jgi:hypothetical protein
MTWQTVAMLMLGASVLTAWWLMKPIQQARRREHDTIERFKQWR